ncbi:MAG: hypothetical protein JST75_10410 [Bacteroidetes bacterium]|nr:hypothetical protein [Bacteroidota bacterium]
MTKFLFFVFALNLMIISISSGQQNNSFDQLQQLGGVWKTEIKGKTIYERWTKISDNELSGKSYMLKNNDTIVFEATRIVNINNELYYIARVRNQNQGQEVSFKLVSSSNKTFVFENPDHDFPQRVAYQFTATDSLHAWIDGNQAGKFSKEDYYYKRDQ